MQTFGMIDTALLHQINKLINENASLKKANHELQLKSIADDVAVHIDTWLNSEYEEDLTEQESYKKFALKITRYIEQKLQN